MNQMNICTRRSALSWLITSERYRACWASVTPNRSPGFVWYPYSVIQTGMSRRLNHRSSDASNRGSCDRVTFGQRTFSVGGAFGRVGYGCVA